MLILAAGAGVAQDRSTPEATVRSFVEAVGAADMKRAAACVQIRQVNESAIAEMGRQFKTESMTATLTDLKSAIDGDHATVTARAIVKHGKPEQSDTIPTTVKLAQVDGRWLIVPDKDLALKQAGPDLVNLTALMLADPEVLMKARDRARAVSCISNVKQICLGLLMLCQDYDEKFKLKPDALRKGVAPYIKNASVFMCPSDTSGTTSYSFNANLAGASLAKIDAPVKTVLVYEGHAKKLDFRHDGKAVVGFVDGHVVLVGSEEAKKLRWIP